MSERLKKLVERKVVEMGKSGEAKFAIEAKVSPSTIRNVRNTGRVSKALGYQIALACGCSEEEAHDISEECSSEAKKAS